MVAFLCRFALIAALMVPCLRAEGQARAPDTLRVVAKIAEPFVMQAEDGSLSGISVDLWDRVAQRLGVAYDIEIMPLDAMLEAVERGEADVGVGAISVTADREARMDLTHGYSMSGFGIAVENRKTQGVDWLAALRNLVSPAFIAAVFALSVPLLGVGFLVWLVERRGNAEHFPSKVGPGIGAGFWFSAVTMTTVGYGDKAPRTRLGRLITLIWMFASIIIISTLTGAIASSLTATQFGEGVRGVEDLPIASVGVVSGTAAERALRNRRISPEGFADVDAGLSAVAAGTVDAFVHDEPILRYHASLLTGRQRQRVRVLDTQFDIGTYAFALPQGSGLSEPINRALLSVLREPDWDETVNRYLSGG